MGGRLKRRGTYVYLCLIDVVWQKPTQHCKAIILQLKLNLKKQITRSVSPDGGEDGLRLCV